MNESQFISMDEAMCEQQRVYMIENYRQTVAGQVMIAAALQSAREGDAINPAKCAAIAKSCADALCEVMFEK